MLTIAIAVGVPMLLFGAYLGLVKYSEAERIEKTILFKYGSANNYYQDGQFERASEAYSEILEFDEKQEKAAHELGKIYNRFNQCKMAQEHFEKYVKIFPDSSRILEGYKIAQSCK